MATYARRFEDINPDEVGSCPCCGGHSSLDQITMRNAIRYRVACDECGLGTRYHYTPDEALENWNHRVAKKHKCVVCGREYEPKQPNQKYCCKSCKQIAHIQRSEPETQAILARIYGVEGQGVN